MTNLSEKALLPSGFHDLLPPEALFQHQILTTLLGCFRNYGYDLVTPPLVEFETSLFAGHGQALTEQTFRLLDPLSHQMMGVRADITMQIARIATTRLRNDPLPLRLSYGGPALRVKGTPLYGERQLVQAGIELIGSTVTETADTEVISVILSSLQAIAIKGLSIDFNLPSFSDILLDHSSLTNDTKKELRHALNRKDSTKVAALGGNAAESLLTLLTPASSAEQTIQSLLSMALPGNARALCMQLQDVITRVKKAHPAVGITIDVLEYHGFEYYSGIGFAIFSTEHATEVARGGHYPITESSSAVGATIDVNTLLRILPLPEVGKRIFLPEGTVCKERNKLIAEGFITVQALEPYADIKKEAERQRCNHALIDGKIIIVA